MILNKRAERREALNAAFRKDKEDCMEGIT